MKPYRSLLFVPGHKPAWVDKAIAAGADALILDLEDAVPPGAKDEARGIVAESIRRVRAGNERTGLFVRPNSWESGRAGQDLEAVIQPGLDGLLLPKIDDEIDVLRFDTLTTHFEQRNGAPAGQVEFLAALETAKSMSRCEAIATAPRVASVLGLTARDADVGRALGFRWTNEGLETLYLRSRVLLANRAAGLSHPICGLWQDIHDIEGLTQFCRANQQLGYRGMVIIHPAHARPVNAVFTPLPGDVDFYRGMIAAFEAGQAAGHGAVQYEEQHIDAAHVKTAREFVTFAERVIALDAARQG